MKASVKKIEKNKVALTVEVPAEQVSTAVDKAFRRLAQSVNIPGFRKGKSPRSVLEARFGIEPAIEDALNTMVPQWYMEAVEVTGIKPVDRPDIDYGEEPEEYDSSKFTQKPLEFTATVVVKPEVRLPDFEGNEVPKESVSIPAKQVQDNIDMLRDRFAKLEPKDDKAKVKEGDFALIDFTGYLDGEEATKTDGYLAEVGSRQLLEDFENNLIGMKKGETKKFDVPFPEDYQRVDLAGQVLSFEVILNEIKEKVLPKADDDFARELGEYETMDELKKAIKKDLSEMKERQVELQFKRDALKKLSDATEMEIPEVMTNSRKEELFREFTGSMSQRGASLEDYFEATGRSREDLLSDLATEAGMQVKNELILDEIAAREELSLSEEELMAELTKSAEQLGRSAEELRKQVKEQGTEGILKESLLREKALDLLTKKAKPVKAVKAEKTGKKEKPDKVTAEKEE